MTILKGVKSEIDVKCEAEVGDGVVVPFIATFRTFTHKERQEFRAALAEQMRDYNPAAWDQAEVVRGRLIGWRDFPTQTDEPLEFNAETLDIVLDAPEYVDALYQGLLRVMNGSAKSGN